MYPPIPNAGTPISIKTNSFMFTSFFGACGTKPECAYRNPGGRDSECITGIIYKEYLFTSVVKSLKNVCNF